MADDTFLRLSEVVRRTTLSRTTIWRKASQGTFPKSYLIGVIAVWSQQEIEEWIEKTKRTPATPLRRGRPATPAQTPA